MPVIVEEGKCESVLEPALDDAKAWRSPIIAILDSWGNAPVPHRLIERIARNPGSEVIVTFKPQHFVRFGRRASVEVSGGRRGLVRRRRRRSTGNPPACSCFPEQADSS